MKQTELISPSPFPENHDESATKISLKGFCKYSKIKMAIANIYLLITFASAAYRCNPANEVSNYEYQDKRGIIRKV